MGLHRFINEALGIIEVSEVIGPGDAGAHAHGNHPGLEPVIAEMALSGYADRNLGFLPRPLARILPGGTGFIGLDPGGPLGIEGSPIQIPGFIGAGDHAAAAPDAFLIIDHYDPGGQSLFALPGGSPFPLFGADGYARRIVAL